MPAGRSGRCEDGALVERCYPAGGTIVRLLAEIAIQDEVVFLNDVAIYAEGEQARIGPGQAMRLLGLLAAEALEAGFAALTISGVRYGGAGPGRLVSITRRLRT